MINLLADIVYKNETRALKTKSTGKKKRTTKVLPEPKAFCKLMKGMGHMNYVSVGNQVWHIMNMNVAWEYTIKQMRWARMVHNNPNFNGYINKIQITQSEITWTHSMNGARKTWKVDFYHVEWESRMRSVAWQDHG